MRVRSARQYKDSLKHFTEQKRRIKEYSDQLIQQTGLSRDAVENTLAPLHFYLDEIEQEITIYEKAIDRNIKGSIKLNELGKYLVGIRIQKRLSQRELARRIGVHESQISREERNDYSGLTINKAQKVLKALESEMVCVINDTLEI